MPPDGFLRQVPNTIVERLMIRGDCMDTRIHVDFETIGTAASSLHELNAGRSSGLDLSALRSDLVTSAAEVFASGWSDVLEFLILTSTALADGVDATLADFLSTEQAHLDSLAMSIGALGR
ncbi:hypothetical protein [Microbacterium sp. MYb62]|uniref:hypothetical protein n=1 Tax=Microbacterium sp. MYb62 TaxID=1848690 RepID=UPI000CFBC445|nr:hypothetical protein [Microbacterium sp. MYb62]PRB16541.1 hypothetical protein CQ042_06715 [Microbacterium sp. MYb62]